MQTGTIAQISLTNGRVGNFQTLMLVSTLVPMRLFIESEINERARAASPGITNHF
jgi:hypothetical protein